VHKKASEQARGQSVKEEEQYEEEEVEIKQRFRAHYSSSLL